MKNPVSVPSPTACSPESALPAATDGIYLLGLAAGGATTLEIAKQVGCSERTVKRKIEEVVIRLGARNRTQAVAIAVRQGLI